jgi:hypothetical protein
VKIPRAYVIPAKLALDLIGGGNLGLQPTTGNSHSCRFTPKKYRTRMA